MENFHVRPKDGITVTGTIDNENFPSRELAQAEIERLGLTETHQVVEGGVEDAPMKPFFPGKDEIA